MAGNTLRLPHPSTVTLLASAARTATASSATQANHEARGVLVQVQVSAFSATPSLTPSIQWSPDDGTTWISYAVFTAVTNVEMGTPPTNFSYLIYPGILATADGALTESVNLPLPRTWRWLMTAGDSDSVTYSVVAQLL